jgi:hypothetical protein
VQAERDVREPSTLPRRACSVMSAVAAESASRFRQLATGH